MSKIFSPKFLIFLVVFVNHVGYGILFPILSLYEKAFNVGPFLIAAAMGAFPIAQFFASPILGILSDRYGRKPLLIVSLLGTIIAFILFAFAGNIYVLFLARIIDGVSGGSLPIALAYMADITSDEKRTEGMGIVAGALSFGFVFGPALGGLLGQFGIKAPSLTAAIFAFMSLILVIFFLEETEKEQLQKKVAKLFIFNEIWQALKIERVGIALILFFMIQTTWSLHMPVFAIFLQEKFAYGTLMAGVLLAYRGVVSTIVQLFLVGKGVNRFGEFRLLKISILIMVSGLFMTAFSPSFIILILGLTLMEFGGDFVSPITNGIVSKWSKPEEQGEMLGIAASMGSLGRIIGPYVGGAAFQTIGIASPFYLGAGLMVAGLIMIF